ncbi:hypothetical protein [Aldersonia kunmingensis]|uniref:hypothetical protein n=1 Tax=Aldersonia kunmingensis TaxID=408066 RepID=UPI00082E6066|nr:hypothetical protein [Aldersonia kunmingensis]
MAGELEIDLGAVRALATAHDRSAAVLEACARMIDQRSGSYTPISRALAQWAQVTEAIAAELAATADRAAATDRETAAGLRDLL